jgi:2-haloacid dehalogenase
MSIPTDAVRWLTFDCYGTLIDWETGILQAVRPVLASRGAHPSDTDVIAAYARLEREIQSGPYLPYRRVLQQVMTGLAHSFGTELTSEESDALPESLQDWPAFSDTAASLQALQSRFRIAVISNIDDDLFAFTAPKLGITLDALITAQQCRSYKPSLNNFHVAMDRLGAQPAEVLHCAESLYHDIAPANRLGIRSVWVNRHRDQGGASASGSAEAAPALEVGSMAELAGALLERR